MNVSELHGTVWFRLLALAQGPAHAILLHGVAGLLKTELARAFAAALLCESPRPEGACGTCAACNWFVQGNHPDFRFVRPDADGSDDSESEAGETAKTKASREIRIEQVRALGDFLNVGAHRAGRRVVLIAPAEAMNRNTANAILKALEEPNRGTVFVLVTDDFDSLLPTLKSRCQKVAVTAPERRKALEWLASHAPGKELSGALDRSGGAPGLALEIAQGAQGRLVDLLERLLVRGFDSRRAAAEVERLIRSESDLEMPMVVAWIQRWLTDMALAADKLPCRYFPGLSTLGLRCDRELLFVNIKKSCEFKVLSRHTLNPRLFLESFFDQCVPALTLDKG